MNGITEKTTVALTSDHRGFPLKQHLKTRLEGQGYTVVDYGTDAPEPKVDAMDYALKVVRAIKEGTANFAIAICGDGQTMAMTANRFPFMRAVLENHAEGAEFARQHHNANMLAIPFEFTSTHEAERVVDVFLTTEALGDRYARRRDKLAALDISALDWNK